MEGVFEVLYDFALYIYNFLTTVPLSISLGSALLVTFIWLLNEVTSLFLFWRAVAITVWGLLIVDYFVPVTHLTSGQLWAYLLIVIATSILASRLTRMKRRKIKCPRCGTLVAWA
jgi:hypothetical protein